MSVWVLWALITVAMFMGGFIGGRMLTLVERLIAEQRTANLIAKAHMAVAAGYLTSTEVLVEIDRRLS